MNREDVIRMAREAGLHLPYWADDEDPEIDPPRWTMVSPLPLLLERFAAVAYAAGAAAEREACAKVCDSKEREKWEQMAKVLTGGLGEVHPIGPKECAAAIRARGEAA